jgi:microcystin-dependent protein
MSTPAPFNNDQPTLPLTELLVEQGIFPGRNTGDPALDSHLDPGGIPMAAIRTFAGNFNFSSSTEMANGQVKSINQNQALFSLLGTNFGGDGRTTFQIPDAQGHVLVGSGQGTALSNEILGQATGSDSVALGLSQMPSSIGGSNAAFDDHQSSLGFNYMINTGGHAPDASMDFVGMVVPTAANFAGDGYLLAQGQTLLIADYPSLFNAIGTSYGGDGTTTFALPDLRGRTIIGSSAQYPVGTYVGQENVSVTTGELPASAGGQGGAIDNHQPSLAMTYLICVSGIFPSQGGGIDFSQPFLGEIVAFAGVTAPRGWMIAAGQALAINQNQALFSLLGTTYGGDGRTTFRLPDLRDHAVVNAGTSAALGTISLGQTYGNDNITLLASNIIDAVPHLAGVAASMSGLQHLFAKIAGSATASDANLDLMNGGRGNYAGASLTIERHGGPNAEDAFGFETTGASFTVSGGNLQSGGNTFASFTNTGGVLTITFDSSSAIATTLLTNNVIEHVTYAHQGPASVVIDLALSDGNSGGQGAGPTPAIDTQSITVNTAMLPPSDFNGNGISDILWRNSSGEVAAWFLNSNGTIGGSADLTSGGVPIAPDPSYSVAAISDFNGDGKADILWRDAQGSLIEWLMNGSVIAQSSFVTAGGTPVNPDPSWTFAGAGDFNGDGMSDMLWRNSSGEVALWQMNGTVIAGSGDLNAGGGAISLDASWSVAGIGDFNGDGKADIIWRNTVTGEVAQWQMNGSTITGSGDLNAGGAAAMPGASWSVAGVGDFNADGNADILWRDSSGSLVEWLMNGTSIIGSAAVTSGGVAVSPDPSWHVVEIGDFNLDARADILWRNDSGAMAEWFMNGTTIIGSTAPTVGGVAVSLDASWQTQAKPTDFA